MDFYGFSLIFMDFYGFSWICSKVGPDGVAGWRVSLFFVFCLKVKKLRLDRVLQSSRWAHWIRLDEIYLAVPLKSLWKSIFTRLKRLDTNLKYVNRQPSTSVDIPSKSIKIHENPWRKSIEIHRNSIKICIHHIELTASHRNELGTLKLSGPRTTRP